MFADIADARLAIHFFYQIEIIIFLRQIGLKLFNVLGIYLSVLKNLICFSRRLIILKKRRSWRSLIDSTENQ